jgi:hypothetical protein
MKNDLQSSIERRCCGENRISQEKAYCDRKLEVKRLKY